MRKKLIISAAIAVILAIAGWFIFRPGSVARIDSFKECANAGYPVTDTNPPTCDDGQKTFVGPRGTPEPTPEALEELDFQVLVEGDSKGTYPARHQLITSQAEWQNFWASVHKGLSPMPNIIPVDFTKNDVIALTMGPEPSDGYSVRMLGLAQSGQTVKADVELRQPASSCKLPAKATDPYFIAMVPKMTGTLKYSINTVTHACG